MTLLILGALAVAWVLVLLPSRRSPFVPRRQRGSWLRGFGSGLSRIRPLGSGRRGLGLGQPGNHFLPPRPQVGGTQTSIPQIGTPNGVSRVGGPPLIVPTNGQVGVPQQIAPQRITPQQIAPQSPQKSVAQLGSPAVRRVVPITTADAALRRRDITAILLTSSVITLVALIITKQAWLGLLYIAIIVALLSYVSLMARRARLNSSRFFNVPQPNRSGSANKPSNEFRGAPSARPQMGRPQVGRPQMGRPQPPIRQQ